MENNKKEDIKNKISETINQSINIIVEKLQKVEEVDSEKAEKLKEKLENLYNKIQEGHLDTFEILEKLMEIQNELIKFLDSDDYKQKIVEEQELENKKEDKSLQVYVQPKISILKKLKQVFEKIFKKLKKEELIES